MSLAFVALVSIVPGALWVWFFTRNDRRPEPVHMLARTFLAGMLSVAPAAFLERPLVPVLTPPSGFGARMVLAVIAIGLIEEGMKLLAAYVAAFRSPHCDEVADGIVYAVTAAFGFATAENLFYTVTFGLNVALVRALITTMAHASFAGVFGLQLGLVRMGRGGVTDLLTGYLLASALHASYDFLIVSRSSSPVIAIALVYGVYRFVVTRLRKVSAGID